MNARTLSPEEWGLVKGTEMEAIAAVADPGRTQIIVCEHRGEVIGCWAVIEMVHVEGLWIKAEHRGRASVARHLLNAMWSVVKEKRKVRAVTIATATNPEAVGLVTNLRGVITGATNPAVAEMVTNLGGVELPGQQFAVPVKGEA